MKKQNRKGTVTPIKKKQKMQQVERERVVKGAIRKRRTREEIATKLQIVEDKDTKEKVVQRNMTEERNIKTGNTFSVLQEDDQEQILEEEEFPPNYKSR